VHIPSGPPTYPVTIPGYFCSAEQKKALVDRLFAEGNAESLYVSQLRDLLQATSRKRPGYSALSQDLETAVAVYKALDQDYYAAQRTPVKDCIPVINGWMLVGYGKNSSTTTINSPFDRQKIKQDPSQAVISGRANIGSWFLTGQATFAGTPNGSFSDVFPATPAFNTTATVNSGNVYGFNGDAGYTVLNAAGWNVGLFGGYYSFNEELYGMFPGFAGTFSLLNDHWRAGEGGVSIDKTFAIGMEPFDFNVTVAGLYDNLRAGAFNGNGGGVRVNTMLSFPLGPVNGNIYAQYANLNASGTNVVPLTFKDQVWTVGFGLSYAFGAPPVSASSPTYPVKALPAK